MLGITRDGNKNALSKPLYDLKIPTLIIWGKEDLWIPISQGKDLKQKIKGSQFKEVSNSGHLPMEENPVEFNNSLLTFIN